MTKNDYSHSKPIVSETASGSKLSLAAQWRYRYWTHVQDMIGEMDGPLRRRTPATDHWMSHGAGKTGILVNMVFLVQEGRIGVEIWLTGPQARSDFENLLQYRQESESAFGKGLNWLEHRGHLDWQEHRGKTDPRIYMDLADTNPEDEADWPRQHRWLVGNAQKLHKVFHPYITRLPR